MSSKWPQLAVLSLVELLAMSLWFSTSSVVGQLETAWELGSAEKAWLTMSVQLGFVVGTLASAVLNLADRLAAHRLVAISALLGGLFNAAIALGISDAAGRTSGGFAAVIALRMLTGVALAGVYPPGMKLMATWFREGRGLAIGVLVGALTLGSASPHLLNTLPLVEWLGETSAGLAAWKLMMLSASGAAIVAALLAMLLVRTGPLLPAATKFRWDYFLQIWRQVAVRRANFGYLGHQWELYAAWTWVPVLLIESYTKAGHEESSGRLAAFAMVGVGAIGCALAGALADRIGRTRITIASLVISCACTLTAGFLIDYPGLLTAVCMVWGFAIVADSAQFSTAVSELGEPSHVGTALTIQTCVGFLLTMVTINMVSVLYPIVGWGLALALLAPGPIFGIYHMARLRGMPEAEKMASGNR
ncbi:MAG: MFS transporter [Planctomycetes bacterium]|nr:MFS transporter [Planctomycetota bacterium]